MLHFFSNDNGGHLFVEKKNEKTCASLTGNRGDLQLINCKYTCDSEENRDVIESLDSLAYKTNQASEKLQELSSEKPSEEEDYDGDQSYNDANLPQPEALIQCKLNKKISSFLVNLIKSHVQFTLKLQLRLLQSLLLIFV